LCVPPGNRLEALKGDRAGHPVTPGELLLEEFLKPMGISQYRLAKEIDVLARIRPWQDRLAS